MVIKRAGGLSERNQKRFAVLAFAVLGDDGSTDTADGCIPNNFYITREDGRAIGVPVVQIIEGDEDLESLVHDVVSRIINNQMVDEFAWTRPPLRHRTRIGKSVAILSEDRAIGCPDGALEVAMETQIGE